MKNFVVATLACLLLAGAAARAEAQQEKPFVVVSVASVDSLVSDLDYIGNLANQPNLSARAKEAIAPLTNAMDKTKPWGATVNFTPIGTPNVLAFLPVTDIKAFVTALEAYEVEAEEQDGLWKLTTEDAPMPIFVKHANNWAYASQSPDALDTLPANPGALLAGLNAKYDVAVRANVPLLPDSLRQQLEEFFKAAVGSTNPVERGADEGDAQFELRKKLLEKQIDEVRQTIADLETLTLGWAIDQTTQMTFLEAAVTAKEGTRTHTQLVNLEGQTTNFAGFRIPSSAAQMILSMEIAESEAEQATAKLEQLRAELMSEITDSDDLPDESKEKVKNAINDIIDVLEATVEAGKLDGGAVLTGTNNFTFAAGGKVVEGEALATAVDDLIEALPKEEEVEIEHDVAKHNEIRFHRIVTPSDQELSKVFGAEASVVIGIGPKSAYFAYGEDGVSTLKKIIDDSAAAGPVDTLPLDLQVSLTPIMRMVAKQQPAAALFAGFLQPGQDSINFKLQPIPNGAAYRYEIQEGVIKMFATIGAMFGPGAAAN